MVRSHNRKRDREEYSHEHHNSNLYYDENQKHNHLNQQYHELIVESHHQIKRRSMEHQKEDGYVSQETHSMDISLPQTSENTNLTYCYNYLLRLTQSKSKLLETFHHLQAQLSEHTVSIHAQCAFKQSLEGIMSQITFVNAEIERMQFHFQ